MREPTPRVAFVSDQLATAGGLGGAERVLLSLHRLFPEAPVYTTVFAPQRMGEPFVGIDVRPSWVDRLPGARRHHAAYLPLMPLAVRSLDLSAYDLVISSHHSVAHGAIVRPDALHVSYCHSPMRYGWDLRAEYLATLPAPARPAAELLLAALRRWDVRASRRVGLYVANSEHVADRIARHYGRSATVVPPPVRRIDARPDPTLGRFHLVVSRLVPYKRVDLAIAACEALGERLVVIGDGPELPRLRALAGPNVTFLGRQPDAEVDRHLASCQALLFPGCEDFGITPLEAMAAGRPVLAYAAGGALETVEDGVTGLFFTSQQPADLAATMVQAQGIAWDDRRLRERADRFSERAFQAAFLRVLEAHTAGRAPGAPVAIPVETA